MIARLLAIIAALPFAIREAPGVHPSEVVGAGAEAAATLPTTYHRRYFIAETTIDGKGPFRMVLDTGATITSLTPEAERAIDPGRHLRLIEIGKFKAEGRVRYAVLDLTQIRHALGVHVDGIIGHQVFRNVLLTYDYPARQVRVRRGVLTDDLPGVAPMAKGKRPFVGAMIGDRSINVLLDTGSSDALSLDRPGRFALEAPPVPVGVRVRVDGPRLVTAARLARDVRFGAFTLERPIVHDAAGESLLGNALLKDFVVTLDQRSGLVQIVDSAGSAAEGLVPSAPLFTHGFVVTARAEHNRVERVFEASPAAVAGLREGDEVIRVNGVSVVDVRAVADPAEPEHPETVMFTVRRGADTFDLRLTEEVRVR